MIYSYFCGTSKYANNNYRIFISRATFFSNLLIQDLLFSDVYHLTKSLAKLISDQ